MTTQLPTILSDSVLSPLFLVGGGKWPFGILAVVVTTHKFTSNSGKSGFNDVEYKMSGTQ